MIQPTAIYHANALTGSAPTGSVKLSADGIPMRLVAYPAYEITTETTRLEGRFTTCGRRHNDDVRGQR